MKKSINIVLSALVAVLMATLVIGGVMCYSELKATETALNETIMKFQQEYQAEVDNLNEDEMDILDSYGPWLAGYARGYRLSLEARGEIVMKESVYANEHGDLQVNFYTRDGGLYSAYLQRSDEGI